MAVKLPVFALASIVLVSVLVLLGLASPMVSVAQDNATPTSGPLFIIPTATPAAPPIDALAGYGLLPGDVPGFVPDPANGLMTLPELADQLVAAYPDRAVDALALAVLYEHYGVVGSAVSRHFTPSCEGQSIFGVATWIRQAGSPAQVANALADPTLDELYDTVLGWRPASIPNMPGKAYTAVVPATLCPTPSTQVVVEYPYGNLIVAVSVYAPDTTDIGLSTSVLSSLMGAVEQRAPQPGDQPVATPVPSSTPQPVGTPVLTPTPLPPASISGRISFADPLNPAQLNPALLWFPGTSPDNRYDLTATPGALTLISGASVDEGVDVCLPYTGDFTAQVTVTIRPEFNEQGANLFIYDEGAWISDNYIGVGRFYYDGHGVGSWGSANGTRFDMIRDDVDYSRIDLKVERRGPTFTVAYRLGLTWVNLRENFVLAMPPTVNICLELYSTAPEAGVSGVFEDFVVTPG